MARPIRFQYPGACYHIIAGGDGKKTIFEKDDDRKVFVARLGEVCGRHGWKVHAWVLTGMGWLRGAFAQGWNRARQRRRYVFQGRYKSVPINWEESGSYYFRIVAD